ncbi:MAG: class I SAM-dependent DNA methyltransferase [Planctomycetota bacterium]
MTHASTNIREQAMYRSHARYYDLIYQWKKYDEEAARLHELITAEGVAPEETVLEAACGTGAHLRHLRRWHPVAGFDLNPEMVALAREALPDVELFQADMTDFALPKPVGALLCLFSSIGYVHPRARLDAAARCFAAAVRPGGALIVEPWLDPDTFMDGFPGMDTYGDDDLKLCRMVVSRREGELSVFDFHWLAARRGRPPVEHFVDRHVLWLCPRDELIEAFDAAGFDCRIENDGLMRGRGLIVGRRRREVS